MSRPILFMPEAWEARPRQEDTTAHQPTMGYWSRRIDATNRLVYRLTDKEITIVECRGHYEDK